MTAVRLRAALVLGLAVCHFAFLSGSAGAAPGDLDPSFDVDGLVTTEIGESGSVFVRVTGVAVQPDGKIVAAGECAGTVSGLAGQNAYCLARYETDGSLDSSFGTGGKVVTTFRVGAALPFDGLDGAIALQADGKIVVAASCPIIEDLFQAQVFCVIRFNTDGSLDDVGRAFISRFANARAVTIQPNGKIVIAGYCSASGIIPSAFCLARFTADLGLDPSWGGDFAGGDGCMLPRPDGCDFVYPAGTIAHMVAGSDATAAVGVVSQPGGKVVAVGSCLLPRSNVPGSQFFCLARWGASGHDLTVTTAIRDHADATSAVVQPDGKIVVAGWCSPGSQFCLARYNAADLSLDGSFGTGGVTDPIEPAPSAEIPFAVALQPDGQIVAAGACGNVAFCLRRYSSDGILDDSYGTDGKATADFGPGVDFALALAIQEDGKSVAAGQCEGGPFSFCLARFDAEATESTPTGITVTPANPTIVNGANQQFTALGTYADGSTADLTSSVTWASATPAVATISAGGLASALAAGTSTISATLGSVSGDTLLTVALTPQTITFDPLADKAYSDPDFAVSATASSGLPVSLAAAGNCTAAGTTVHITGAGSCTITASQPGNASYAAAPSVSRTFSIAKAGQTITFAALANKRLGDPDFTVAARASSGLPVAFSARGNCTIAGARVHLVGVGSCTITASQAGNANYNAAPAVSRTFSIARRVQPRCTVPRVIAKPLAVARSMLSKAHCRTGTVTRVYSRARTRGVVIGQSRRPGRVLPANSKIDLVVSRGRRG